MVEGVSNERKKEILEEILESDKPMRSLRDAVKNEQGTFSIEEVAYLNAIREDAKELGLFRTNNSVEEEVEGALVLTVLQIQIGNLQRQVDINSNIITENQVNIAENTSNIAVNTAKIAENSFMRQEMEIMKDTYTEMASKLDEIEQKTGGLSKELTALKRKIEEQIVSIDERLTIEEGRTDLSDVGDGLKNGFETAKNFFIQTGEAVIENQIALGSKIDEGLVATGEALSGIYNMGKKKIEEAVEEAKELFSKPIEGNPPTPNNRINRTLENFRQ